MSVVTQSRPTRNQRMALHWYDFLCPFCYIGQSRNAMLVRHGLDLVELPFQIHPEIPYGGISVGPRKGPMYTILEREAKEAGLQLNWPLHLPNSRPALAAAEWARRFQPREFSTLHRQLFEAHFVLGEDIEDPAVIDRHANASGVDLAALHLALSNGNAESFVAEAEERGRRHGVHSTPAWLLNDQLIEGLQSANDFERLAERALQTLR